MNKKLITAIKYQLKDLLKPLIIFYAIEYGLVMVSLLINANIGEGSVGVSGLEINSLVFLSFCGVLTFTTNFKFFIQNGMTRNNIFKSFICEFIIISFLMALVETVIAHILYTNFDYQYSFQMIYGDNHGVAISFFWLFALYFMVTMLIYLSANIKNRIGKKPFVITMVGLTLIVLILMPSFNILTDGMLFQKITPLLIKIMGFVDGQINFIYPIFTFTIIAVIAVICSYLFTRKTQIL
jgi:hypothetical protein